MIILAIIWFGYIVYEALRMLFPRDGERKITVYKYVKLAWDLFLDISLLGWGLALEGVIQLDEWLFIVLGAIYFVGLVFIEKIKDPDKDQTTKGSDINEHQK